MSARAVQRLRHGMLAVLAALVSAAGAAAQPLEDPEAEQRAASLMREIACMVCDGQAIAESDAPVAVRMRAQVRAAVAEGLSDGEVRARIAERYGDAALLRPTAKGAGLILWLAPLAIVILGAATSAMVFKRGGREEGDAPS